MPNLNLIFKNLLHSDKSGNIEKYLAAITRLGVWNKGLMDGTLTDDGYSFNETIKVQTAKAYELRTSKTTNLLESLQSSPLSEAAFDLLNAASSTDQTMPEFTHFLHFLNQELVAQDTHNTDEKHRNDYILRQIYRHNSQHPTTLGATLALFDVYLDDIEMRKQSPKLNVNRVTSLCKYVFLPVAVGMNISILHQRWSNIIHPFRQTLGFSSDVSQRKAKEDLQARAVHKIIKQMQEKFSSTQIQFVERCYPTHELIDSRFSHSDISILVFIRVICEELDTCYLVEAWLERQGLVWEHLTRKSLYHPDLNSSARRFQLGILWEQPFENHQLFVMVEMGNRATHYWNDWGQLTYLASPDLNPYHLPVTIAERAIRTVKVFETTGQPNIVNEGTNIQQFLHQRYTRIYPYYSRHQINTETDLGLDYVLADGDIVKVIFDNSQQYQLQEQSNYFKRAARTSSDIHDLAQKGQNRLLLKLNHYLYQWDIQITSNQLLTVLQHFQYIDHARSIPSVLANFFSDESQDEVLCRRALQYSLRGRVRPQRAEDHIPGWRYIEIAQCCKPTFKDATIVATRRNNVYAEENTPYWRIHRKGCLSGPSPQNTIELCWIRPDSEEVRGLILQFNMPNGDGILGNLLHNLYDDTELELHYVHADAITARPKAIITIYASAHSKYALEQAREFLSKLYMGPNHRFETDIVLTMLDIYTTDTVALLRQEANPFTVATEALLSSHLPIRCVGRESIIQHLLTSIYSPVCFHTVLLGYYRVGKTWLCVDVIQRLKPAQRTFLPVYVDCHAIVRRQHRSTALSEISYAFHGAILDAIQTYGAPELKVPSIVNAPISRDLEDLKHWISKIAKICQPVLFLDEFTRFVDWQADDYLNISHLRILWRFVYKETTAKFVLVFQKASTSNLTDVDARAFNDHFLGAQDDTIEIEPFSAEQTRNLICHPLCTYTYSDQAIDYIHQLAGGITFLITLIAHDMWEIARKSYLKVIELEHVQALEERILNSETWKQYLARLVSNLRDDVQTLLIQIARFEQQTKREFWDENIFQNAHVNEEVSVVLLAELQQVGILEADFSMPILPQRWRIRGQILSRYLSQVNPQTLRNRLLERKL
jgi:hypothetical protein